MPLDSDEESQLDAELEGFAVSDIDAFEEHPIWKNFMLSNERKIKSLEERIIHGDIALYVQADPDDYFGSKHRTNEALRGGILELTGISLYLDDVRAVITAMQKELPNQEEEILEDE